MHPSISMRSVDAGFPDLPPASFDYMPSDFTPPEPITPPPAIAQAAVDVKTRTPIKIARAISGTSEIRLLRQSSPGLVDTFVLEHATLQPYTPTRTELVKEAAPGTALTEAEALEAYAAAVQIAYPTEKLRSGREVRIHEELIK